MQAKPAESAPETFSWPAQYGTAFTDTAFSVFLVYGIN